MERTNVPPSGWFRPDHDNVLPRARTPPASPATANRPPRCVRWLGASRFHRPLYGSLLVLHVTARRTGRHYDIPAGYVRLGDRLLVTRSIGGGRTFAVVRASTRRYAVCGVRRTARLRLDEDPASIARTPTWR